MVDVVIGLTTEDGDRLGHLVRGVQMLRSYGREFEVEQYSDVIHADTGGAGLGLLCCTLHGRTAATPEGLKGICRETEWALGDEPEVLSAFLLEFGGKAVHTNVPRVLESLSLGLGEPGSAIFMDAGEFETICGWGQQLADGETRVIGEWPSATGR